MKLSVDQNKTYLQTYQRGAIFQAGDFLGKIPAIGVAIGAIRVTGSLVGMLGAGFVYGGAYCVSNEALKEKCLFAHERAIDETIRGIYETIFYGAFSMDLGRKIASKFVSWVSVEEKNHNYFAHGSHFTVDANRRIRYYFPKTEILPAYVADVEKTLKAVEFQDSDSAAMNDNAMYMLQGPQEVTLPEFKDSLTPISPSNRKAFFAKLLQDLEDIRARYPKPNDADACYF